MQKIIFQKKNMHKNDANKMILITENNLGEKGTGDIRVEILSPCADSDEPFWGEHSTSLVQLLVLYGTFGL